MPLLPENNTRLKILKEGHESRDGEKPKNSKNWKNWKNCEKLNISKNCEKSVQAGLRGSEGLRGYAGVTDSATSMTFTTITPKTFEGVKVSVCILQSTQIYGPLLLFKPDVRNVRSYMMVIIKHHEKRSEM